MVTRRSSGSESAAKRQKTEPKDIAIGDSVPNVTLEDQDGEKHAIAEIKGVLALFSYPKASTPGCTTQTRKFGELYEEFEKLGATVFGISADSLKAQTTFKNKLNLGFSLLSDPNFELLEPLGAKKTAKGGVVRSHWVFKDGKCTFAEHSVKPGASPEDTLAAVKEALGESNSEGSDPEEDEAESKPEESKPEENESEDFKPNESNESKDSEPQKESKTIEANVPDADGNEQTVKATISGEDIKKSPEVVAKIASHVIAEVVTKASDTSVDSEGVDVNDKSQTDSQPKKLQEAKEDDEISGDQPDKSPKND